MAENDCETTGKYCPFNGFNPPCGFCMFAMQVYSDGEPGEVACAVAVNAWHFGEVFVKNTVKPKVVS